MSKFQLIERPDPDGRAFVEIPASSLVAGLDELLFVDGYRMLVDVDAFRTNESGERVVRITTRSGDRLVVALLDHDQMVRIAPASVRAR